MRHSVDGTITNRGSVRFACVSVSLPVRACVCSSERCECVLCFDDLITRSSGLKALFIKS